MSSKLRSISKATASDSQDKHSNINRHYIQEILKALSPEETCFCVAFRSCKCIVTILPHYMKRRQ